MPIKRPEQWKSVLRYPEGQFDPKDWLRFVYLPPFEQKCKRFGLGDDFIRMVEIAIMASPKAFPVLVKTGGLRKLRMARKGEGKSGGFRICYVYFESYGLVVVVTMFSKGEKDDLPASERATIAALISAFEVQLAAGGLK